MQFLSNMAVLYICVAAVLSVSVVSCNSNSGLSDRAAEALVASCTAAGQVPDIKITKSQIDAKCVPK